MIILCVREISMRKKVSILLLKARKQNNQVKFILGVVHGTQSPYMRIWGLCKINCHDLIPSINFSSWLFNWAAPLIFLKLGNLWLGRQSSSLINNFPMYKHLSCLSSWLLFFRKEWTRWGSPSSRCRSRCSGRPRESRTHRSCDPRCSATRSCTSSQTTSSCRMPPTITKLDCWCWLPSRSWMSRGPLWPRWWRSRASRHPWRRAWSSAFLDSYLFNSNKINNFKCFY